MAPRVDPDLVLDTPRLHLRLARPEEAALLQDFQIRNREIHARFNAPYSKGFFELDYWRERLARQREELLQDRTLCLTAFLREELLPEGVPARVVATCNFTKFVRGRFQACYLGYHVDHEYEGQGFVTETLRGAIPFVFRELRMHRIMANYVPENLPSERVLERLGFVKEGIARDYLFVAGGWSDHVLTSLTNPEPMEPEL